jgi:hypothetical protein
MKLSIEAKVATAVATAFVALTVCAIGQERGRSQIAGPSYGPTAETQLSQQAYNRPLFRPR